MFQNIPTVSHITKFVVVDNEIFEIKKTLDLQGNQTDNHNETSFRRLSVASSNHVENSFVGSLMSINSGNGSKSRNQLGDYQTYIRSISPFNHSKPPLPNSKIWKNEFRDKIPHLGSIRRHKYKRYSNFKGIEVKVDVSALRMGPRLKTMCFAESRNSPDWMLSKGILDAHFQKLTSNIKTFSRSSNQASPLVVRSKVKSKNKWRWVLS